MFYRRSDRPKERHVTIPRDRPVSPIRPYEHVLHSAREVNAAYVRWAEARQEFEKTPGSIEQMTLDEAERALNAIILDNAYILSPLKRAQLPAQFQRDRDKRLREDVALTVLEQVQRRLVGHPRQAQELKEFEARSKQFELDVQAWEERVAQHNLGIRVHSKTALTKPVLRGLLKPFDPVRTKAGRLTSFNSFLMPIIRTTTDTVVHSKAEAKRLQIEVKEFFEPEFSILTRKVDTGLVDLSADDAAEVAGLLKQAIKEGKITRRQANALDPEALAELLTGFKDDERKLGKSRFRDPSTGWDKQKSGTWNQ